ncbi:MAG: ABC transporter permease [Dehalococcoidia bacterium]|nr:ABC transporter permease [Dehalococcoidia bacterium]
MDSFIQHLSELYRYRGLIKNLVARDLKARYKNSVLGFAWCLINPLMMMVVFTLVFGVLMRNNIPNFPVFLLIGLLPWNLTAGSVMGSMNSIIGNGHLIKKVYFPREILPISMVCSNLVNFLLACVVLAAMLLVFRVELSPLMLYFPVILLIHVIFLLGLALLFSSLNVFFRDTEVIMEVVVLAWFFMTPVFYNIEDLTSTFSRLMYILNPMASIISTYRLVLLYHSPPAAEFLLRTLATSVAVLLIGYWFFLRQAPAFGEEV